MSAPSFSSFPPSFSYFPDIEPGPSKPSSSKREDTQQKDKVREKRDKERKKKERKGERRRGDGYDVSDEERRRRKKESRRRDEGDLRDREDYTESRNGYSDMGSGTVPLFYSDRKSDQLNLTYGGLHAGDVPRYNLVCRGKKILGLPALTVVHRGRHDISATVWGKRKLPSLTDPSSRHILNAPPTRRLLSTSQDKHKYQEIEGFLRISSGHHHRTSDPSYRSITHSKHDPESDETDTSDGDASGGSDSESDTTPVTSLQATLKGLEEKLTAKPDSIPTWLSLLAHTLSTVPLLSKNAVKARAEISLSILSRALSAHSHNAHSKKLRIKYLKAGEDVWHASKLLSEWEDALKFGGTEIWLEWLDWRIRNAQNGLESVTGDVGRVYAALGVSLEDELARLRVFWRVAVAMRDAGFAERATALFQAQAELIYNAPGPLIPSPLEQQLDQLEEFWESEFPRAGEAKATGWAAWYTSSRPQWEFPSTPVTDPHLSGSGDPYTRWAGDESSMDHVHQLPTRTIDDTNEDPYSTILFSDVRPFLLQLQSTRAKEAFRLVWLSFLGLHIPGLSGSLSASPEDCTDDRWACGHLCTHRSLSAIFPAEKQSRITADSHVGVLIGRERDYSSVFGPVKNWSYGVFDPLEAVGKNHWGLWSPADLEGVNHELVREVFKQCRVEGITNTDWDILMIAFETATNLKNASKISKSLLAKDQGSLPLWAAHGRIERLRGRVDEARKLYQTVLTSVSADRPGQSALWWDWAEMEWLSGKSEAAVQVMVRSTGSQGIGGIAILRAKRYLEDVVHQCPASRWKERVGWLKVKGLLELLTSSPAAALATLDAHLDTVNTGSPVHESLTVALLALLYNHGTVLRSPMPPSLLRERAQKAMEVYPNNTFVLGVFLEGEKGQGVWGRLRAMLGGDEAGGGEKDVPRRVAEVWVASWDGGRWEAEEERTRNRLSGAVEDERSRGSSVLWRVYLEFEIRCGQLERAKKLLFRAVKECPLVKELYLLAFGALRPVFSSRELNDWGENMIEKGIRMRRGLDDALGGWAVTHGGVREDQAEDDELEDEIEYNARELRRLRPY